LDDERRQVTNVRTHEQPVRRSFTKKLARRCRGLVAVAIRDPERIVRRILERVGSCAGG